MKFLSLFSGIEAASVAWQPLGWECVGFSEIEPFPCSLLAHHYPDVPNLGDVTKITEQQVADLGDFDLVVFGSPCTNLSVSGDRKGFGGDQSVLFFDALRVFDYARKHNNCRFALWENVPGAFSSNKGADFAAVVREMAGLQDVPVPRHGWGNTGATVGANGLLEWRVLDAQYFGLAQRRKRVFAILDTGNWLDRPPILFERESLRGDTQPSREKGCENPAVVGAGSTTSNGQTLEPDVVYGFDSKPRHPSISEELAPTAVASSYIEPLGVIAGSIIGRQLANGGNKVGTYASETCPTLTTTDRHAVIHDYVVRRLTPMEYERLQGFPDGYTDVLHNSKPATNSVRYKALGNSMATTVMEYIGRQIQNAVDFNRTKERLIPMMTQSPTSLQTFLTCPKQYEVKYITKEVKFESNDHAVFGDLVHKSIEAYLKGLELLPSMLEPLRKTLDAMGPVLYGAETKLAVDKEGKPVEFFSKTAYQRCIVDAMLSNADKSTIVCIDWKTGKKRDAQMQHDFIKKCVRAKHPGAKVVTLFIYLFEGTYDRQEYTGRELTQLNSNMIKLHKAYADKSFPPKPSGLCKKWCDVLSCPHNGRN